MNKNEKPVTPDDLDKIFRNVLHENDTLPNPNDPLVAFLARDINRLRYMYLSRKGWLKEHEEQRMQFAEAVRTLSGLIPKLRPIHQQEVEYAKDAVERYGEEFQASVELTQRNLKAFDNLGEALDVAMALGLPIGDIEILAPNFGENHRERWRGYVKPSHDAFKQALPGRKSESGYRFVTAIIPNVTGEKPNFGTVRQLILDRRTERKGRDLSADPANR